MSPVEASDVVMTRRVPGTSGRASKYVTFGRPQRTAVEQTASIIADDPRLEHLKDAIATVWELAVRISVNKTSDHVPEFLNEHVHQVLDRHCYLPVRHLRTNSRWSVDDVVFLPPNDTELAEPISEVLRLGPQDGTVAQVRVSGTNPGRMADRARAIVDAALRALRLDIGLSQMGVRDEQLRFRRADTFAFDDGRGGWQLAPGWSTDLEAIPDIAAHLADGPFSKFVKPPADGLHASVGIALKWLERATFADDPLIASLFSFFGLEAVLGRTSDKQKGDSLAVRVMTLDHEMTGSFSHPNRLWHDYGRIRSAAVHGSDLPAVRDQEARQFRHDVTTSVQHAISLSEREQLRTKRALLRWLDNHPDLRDLGDWLVRNGGEDWRAYFSAVVPSEVQRGQRIRPAAEQP